MTDENIPEPSHIEGVRATVLELMDLMLQGKLQSLVVAGELTGEGEYMFRMTPPENLFALCSFTQTALQAELMAEYMADEEGPEEKKG